MGVQLYTRIQLFISDKYYPRNGGRLWVRHLHIKF